MSASALDRRNAQLVEQTIEAQILVEDLARIDAAGDIRRRRVQQLLGEAQQQLATIARLDALEDQSRIKLANTLRALAGCLDGVRA